MISYSDRWFRSSRAETEAHRDAPTLEVAGLSFFALTYARLFSVSMEFTNGDQPGVRMNGLESR
jgi:hypothetical protein